MKKPQIKEDELNALEELIGFTYSCIGEDEKELERMVDKVTRLARKLWKLQTK